MSTIYFDLVPGILVYADDDTLHSCALVHRSWTAPSQRLLFQDVVIKASGNRYLGPGDTSCSTPWMRLMLLLEATPHLRPYIQILHFPPDIHKDNRRQDASIGPVMFPNVHTVQFDSRPLWHLVLHLPRLIALACRAEYDAIDGPANAGQLQLQSLNFRGYSGRRLLPSWAQLPSMQNSLRKLSLSVLMRSPMSPSVDFGTFSLPFLEDLTLMCVGIQCECSPFIEVMRLGHTVRGVVVHAHVHVPV
jgi:hypothetical protein